MTDAEKAEIDGMTYEDMLRKHRFAPAGDPYFRIGSKVAEYFTKTMAEKRAVVGDDGHTRASKRIGWFMA